MGLGWNQQETSSSISMESTSSLSTTGTSIQPSMFASGQATGDDQQMEQDPNEMMDPNLLNPLSKQGYGKEDPLAYNVNKNKKQDKTDKKKAAEEAYKNRSMGEQTKQAALQMGVLVSVFLLFAL